MWEIAADSARGPEVDEQIYRARGDHDLLNPMVTQAASRIPELSEIAHDLDLGPRNKQWADDN